MCLPSRSSARGRGRRDAPCARVGFGGGEDCHGERLVAKVDSAAVQEEFDLYLHGFFVTDGHWAVVQQRMNGDRRQASRTSSTRLMRRLRASTKAKSSIWPTACRTPRAGANSTCWPPWDRTGSYSRRVGGRQRAMHRRRRRTPSRHTASGHAGPSRLRAGDVNRWLHATLAAGGGLVPADRKE